jgi:hypothetical protein
LARSPYFCWLCPYIRPKLTRIPLLIIWVYGGYNELVFMCFLEPTKRTGGPSHCMFGEYLDISYIRVIFCGKIYRMDTQLDTWPCWKWMKWYPLVRCFIPLTCPNFWPKWGDPPKSPCLVHWVMASKSKSPVEEVPWKNGPHLKTPVRPVCLISPLSKAKIHLLESLVD